MKGGLKKAAKIPPFTQMCAEAIVSLKDRTGTSRHAIKAYIEAKYGLKNDIDYLPSKLTTALNTQWFVNNNCSYKLSDQGKEHFSTMIKQMRY